MKKLIPIDRSIIPACDINNLGLFAKIISETAELEKVGAYKVGLELIIPYGLKNVIKVARRYTDKPIIYDHQKGGTDIPELGKKFAKAVKEAGADAVILFPQAGPITEYEWIKAAQDNDLGIIVGGEMTHPRYLQGDFSEGKDKNYTKIFREIGIETGFERGLSGFIRVFAPDDMYELAARMGVTDFVVPGNKPDIIEHYKKLIESCCKNEIVFYSPGFVAQGGEISKGAKAAGERFHAIVGRGFSEAGDIKKAAIELTSQL